MRECVCMFVCLCVCVLLSCCVAVKEEMGIEKKSACSFL